MLSYFILFTTSYLAARSILTSKTCIETIDLGYSMYTINHTIYQFPINNTVSVGYGHHDLNILPNKTIVRLYNYPFTLFPTKIHRNAYSNDTYPFDAFLIHETQI